MRDGRDDFDSVTPQDNLPDDPLLSHPSHDAGAAHIPDHIVDRFFDRELTRREATGLFESFRSDPSSARKFVQTQRMLDALKEPVRTPDFTRSILSRIDEASPAAPLLTRRGVRQVRVGRYAAAAALVALIGGTYIAQRLNPNVVEIAGADPSPLGELRSTVAVDASDALNTIQQTRRAIEVTASSSMLRGVSAESGQEMHFVGTPAHGSMMTIKARFVPDIAFPWRARSVPPSDTKSVAWVVPCGAAPCDAAPTAPCAPSLIFVDLAQPPEGRQTAGQTSTATGRR